MVISEENLRELVVKNKLADENQLDNLVAYAKSSEISLTEVLIERDIVSDEQLGLMIADFLNIFDRSSDRAGYRER